MDKNLKVANVKFYKAVKNTTVRRGPKRPLGPTILYVSPQGETISENLANRRQRPNTTYKKLLKAYGLEHLNIPPDHKLAWNQKAGCGCGCSPGFFILDKDGYRATLFSPTLEPLRAIDVAVTEVTEEAPATTDPQV